VLFVLSRTAKMSVERTTIAILPWLVPLFASLIVCTYVPDIVLWLPRHSAELTNAVSSLFK
jgi:TRAP-type C4-dicarboxylate transport system permease large subunit